MYRKSIKLKACPRCGGDILVDRSIEEDEVCIQCGFRGLVRVAGNEDSQYQLETIIHHLKEKQMEVT